MALHGLHKLAEQCQLLFCVDRLRSEARKSASREKSLECHIAVHSTDLASGRSDMTRFEKAVTGSQRPLADAQSALVNVEVKREHYDRHLGDKEQQRGSLESLLHGLRSCLVDHAS